MLTVLMILPPPPCAMNCLAGFLYADQHPMALTSMTRCQSASVMSLKGFTCAMPALLNIASSRPMAGDGAGDQRADAGAVGHIAAMPMAWPPASRIAAAVAWAVSGSISAMTTRAPARASPRPCAADTASGAGHDDRAAFDGIAHVFCPVVEGSAGPAKSPARSGLQAMKSRIRVHLGRLLHLDHVARHQGIRVTRAPGSAWRHGGGMIAHRPRPRSPERGRPRRPSVSGRCLAALAEQGFRPVRPEVRHAVQALGISADPRPWRG